MKRLFIDIQGDVYDLWQIVSITQEMEYNELADEMQYHLILNRTSKNREIDSKIYKYSDREERDAMAANIKTALKNHPRIFFLGENDADMYADEEDAGEGLWPPARGRKYKLRNQEDDGPEYGDDEED